MQRPSTAVFVTSVSSTLTTTASGLTLALELATIGKLVHMYKIHVISPFTIIIRSFRWFITTLVSALAGAVLLFCFNLALFILFFADRESLRYGCDRPTNVSSCDATLRVFSVAVPDPVFPTITAVMSVLGGVAILLIGHLTAFHLYLSEFDTRTHLWSFYSSLEGAMELKFVPFCSS